MRYLIGVSILMAFAGRVHAQSSALAEQLFNEARDLAQKGRWAEACPKFEASMRYDPALGTRLNLATCYEQIGRIASAWGLYRDSIELAKKAGDTKRAAYAERQAAGLEPRLPKLVMVVPPEGRPAGLVVKRDGTPMDPGEFGVALYIDPGAHEFEVFAPNFEAFTQSITTREGTTETLEIPPLKAKPATHGTGTQPGGSAPGGAGALGNPPASTAGSRGARSRTRTYVALGLGAGGVAAGAVGFVFGAKARSTDNDVKDLCGVSLSCSPDNFEEGKRLYADARSSATLSTVLVAAGGAVIVAGAIVFLTAPRAVKERVTTRVIPVIHDRGTGVGVVGRF